MDDSKGIVFRQTLRFAVIDRRASVHEMSTAMSHNVHGHWTHSGSRVDTFNHTAGVINNPQVVHEGVDHLGIILNAGGMVWNRPPLIHNVKP